MDDRATGVACSAVVGFRFNLQNGELARCDAHAACVNVCVYCGMKGGDYHWSLSRRRVRGVRFKSVDWRQIGLTGLRRRVVLDNQTAFVNDSIELCRRSCAGVGRKRSRGSLDGHTQRNSGVRNNCQSQ